MPELEVAFFQLLTTWLLLTGMPLWVGVVGANA
jgi:hypothetical protein